MSVEGILVVAIAVMGAAAILRVVPRCPECGSTQVQELWAVGRIWICERCENVFRHRRLRPMHPRRKEIK